MNGLYRQQGAQICEGGGHLRGTSVKVPCLQESYVDSLAISPHLNRNCRMVSVRDFRMTDLVGGYIELTPWTPDSR